MELDADYKTAIRHILLKKLENPVSAVSIQEAADAGKDGGICTLERGNVCSD